MHKLDRNMPCWCGSGKKYKHCHYDFDEKLDDMHRRGAIIPTHDMIKNEAQIAAFTSLMGGHNNRPVQPVNARPVLQ